MARGGVVNWRCERGGVVRDAIFSVRRVVGGSRCRGALTRVMRLEVRVVECHGAIFVVLVCVKLAAAHVAAVASRRGGGRARSNSVRQRPRGSALVRDGG